jgi:four helix bundle protein
VSAMLPEEEKFGLKTQLCRAAVSVPSNIAEGSSSNSEIEYKRFLEITMGSLFELETQLIIIQELCFIPEEKINKVLELVHVEQKMINNLITKLKAISQ